MPARGGAHSSGDFLPSPTNGPLTLTFWLPSCLALILHTFPYISGYLPALTLMSEPVSPPLQVSSCLNHDLGTLLPASLETGTLHLRKKVHSNKLPRTFALSEQAPGLTLHHTVALVKNTCGQHLTSDSDAHRHVHCGFYIGVTDIFLHVFDQKDTLVCQDTFAKGSSKSCATAVHHFMVVQSRCSVALGPSVTNWKAALVTQSGKRGGASSVCSTRVATCATSASIHGVPTFHTSRLSQLSKCGHASGSSGRDHSCFCINMSPFLVCSGCVLGAEAREHICTLAANAAVLSCVAATGPQVHPVHWDVIQGRRSRDAQ